MSRILLGTLRSAPSSRAAGTGESRRICGERTLPSAPAGRLRERVDCAWRSTATAATAASAPAPTSSAVAAPPQESGPTYYESTGLDFIDLVHLDERVVHTRLHEAVLFRTLVCSAGATSACPTWRRASFTAAPTAPAPPAPSHTCGAPVASAAAEPINVKRLKSYRDHVTRNLAPTVAKGFATAARAAGIIIAAAPPATAAIAAASSQQPSAKTSPTATAASTGSLAVGPAGNASSSTGGVASSSPASRQQLQKQGQAQLQGQTHHHNTSAGGGGGGSSPRPSPRTAISVKATGSAPSGLSGSVAAMAASAAASAAVALERPPVAVAAKVVAAAAAWGPPPANDIEVVGSGAGGMFDF
ncbi:hypothetical protein CHLRE_02g074200v5 [Chlamydomonas reinhardtii]|uniref:Uncharacterized protein n=1 Tax=Chlamydomonas reinhardtii TaxID=3055 RepID=A0A2K3E008_CHLRE|nr:uncharacterized protein CHLRE_02g074200v5 [Chlamydomonas reinhardtii]PNW86123.1 hypothetical protein CHLRE_02g074200v5 [Chlamydomonas reinhardtii]